MTCNKFVCENKPIQFLGHLYLRSTERKHIRKFCCFFLLSGENIRRQFAGINRLAIQHGKVKCTFRLVCNNVGKAGKLVPLMVFGFMCIFMVQSFNHHTIFYQIRFVVYYRDTKNDVSIKFSLSSRKHKQIMS
jgi:hypothetical protein